MKILLAFVLGCAPLWAGTTATGGPGVPFSWANSEKQGFGTAYESYDPDGAYSERSFTAPISRVWFTISRGILTEVFYPRVDTAQTRDTQLLVSDGKTFLHQEQYDTDHTVERVEGAPFYRVTNRDRQDRYRIEKEIWADPDSDTIIQKIRIVRNVDGLQFYVLHKPAAANSIFGDTASRNPFIAGETHGRFTGWQGLAASVPWKKTSVGYVGRTDGFTDLDRTFTMQYEFDEAPKGNVALTGQLEVPETRGTSELVLFLFFGQTREAIAHRHQSILGLDVSVSRSKFLAQWRQYLRGLDLPVDARTSASRKALVENSVLLLKSAEDKTYAGAIVASPTHPWGEQHDEDESSRPENNTGYHVVWPRDLYHVSGAFFAVGDQATLRAILERLKQAQYRDADGEWEFGPRSHAKRGSFPQNFWVDGQTGWGGYQADETSMPCLLAYRLWKQGWVELQSAWPLVKEAAKFLAEMGPWTQGERWEELYGISPNSAGYVIAALVTASEMATAVNETALAQKWLALADQWSVKNGENIEAWTFATNGKIQAPLAHGRYYERINGASCHKEDGGSPIWDAPWNPDIDGYMNIGSIPGPDRFKLESEVVDSSFLALVRTGVRSARNAFVRETLPVIDAVLRKDTPRGTGYYRYRYDGYGEGFKGRLWPLLTGERIHYELQWLKETLGPSPAETLEPQVRGLEAFAGPTGIFAEQVWDEGDKAGLATGSAAPLSWSHAEYLQVLRSLREGRVLEELPTVRARYANY